MCCENIFSKAWATFKAIQVQCVGYEEPGRDHEAQDLYSAGPCRTFFATLPFLPWETISQDRPAQRPEIPSKDFAQANATQIAPDDTHSSATDVFCVTHATKGHGLSGLCHVLAT